MRRRWKANEKLQNILGNERRRRGRRDARRAQRRKFTFGVTFHGKRPQNVPESQQLPE